MARPTKEFKENILEPSLNEFRERHEELHLAFAAVAAVDAYAAHIFREATDMEVDVAGRLGFDIKEGRGLDDSWFRNEIAKKHRHFAVLRDAAKANKHALLTRYTPIVNGSGDTQLEARGFGVSAYGTRRYSGTPEVVIKDVRGDTHYIEELLDVSVEILDEVAHQLDIPI